MSPIGLIASSVFSIAGMGLGILGLLESSPVLTGVGFVSTVSLQLWTMGKLGPIDVRIAVLETRLEAIEGNVGGRKRQHHAGQESE